MARRKRTFCGCNDEKMPARDGFSRAFEQRQAIDGQRRVNVGGADHLDEMPDETEPGHVGRGMDAVLPAGFGPPRRSTQSCERSPP